MKSNLVWLSISVVKLLAVLRASSMHVVVAASANGTLDHKVCNELSSGCAFTNGRIPSEVVRTITYIVRNKNHP